MLLPFFWIRRWVQMLFHAPSQVKHGLSASRQMLRSGADALSAYEAQLHTVGLDFNLPGQGAGSQNEQDP